MKSIAENNREVSLLSIISRVLQRCLFFDLYNFLEPYFNDFHIGFREHCSCVVHLLIFFDQVYHSLNFVDVVRVVYTDNEEASDKNLSQRSAVKSSTEWVFEEMSSYCYGLT